MGSDTKISKAELFIQNLNASNAKKLALLMVLGFTLYHGFLHLRYGNDSCKWLLSDGRFKGDKEWQPFGCMLHKYTETDTRKCFRYLAFWGTQNHFVFIGDVRIRSLYLEMVNHLKPPNDADNASIQSTLGKTENLQFVDFKLRLQINYIYASEVSKVMIDEFIKWQHEEDPPSLIVASCTYSSFHNGNVTKDIQKAFEKNLTRMVKPIDALVAKKSKVIWKLQDPIDHDRINDEWKNVQNEDIDRINQVVYDILGYSDAKIWSSGKMIASGLRDEFVDGHKLGTLALKHDVQILLNMYCNDYMNYNDGTCCSSAETHTIIQVITYALLGVCLAIAGAMIIRRWFQKLRGVNMYMPLSQTAGVQQHAATSSQSPVMALASLAVIMVYFYLCDRTNFFMKENKYYSEFSFWIPVGYVFVLGLFFTEDSKFTKVLHRDQTDELKGWMQLVILIYYMTGASHVLPIYMQIKVLISGYLFLSGYGHFTYCWQTGNLGLERFLSVMFKINFFTVVLCLCMNRPYQFYFFVPLLSFWFCMIYFLLSIPPRITAQSSENNAYQYLYVVLKFVCILSVITILYMSEVFFERIFVTRPWKALFVTTDDDVTVWWYRWKLDRYTITFGMIFAAIFHIAQKYYIFDDNNHGNLFSRRISLSSTLAAIIGIGFYTTWSFFCRNKQDCEEIHSYVVFIPIVGYILLRNISGILRTRYSTFFAWFGRISLELFICQYHIWLAADRNGVLVLLPGFPTLNVLITSFIFVCVSHEVHRLTTVLLPYAVPNDWKLALRNLLIFAVVLIPIGRYDGMF
ncbi:CAS1 domain containing 1 [Culex quinquefasciatus]|uniref:CAS1 domain containing 1 n=3 Tax=Culex pipiens complex TaxID=518105 RepID=B0W8N6_CULQU|nr:N-acetylneuraminate 9-O-acetyltransferase [Culex quinquefasciatus]EDS39086.1 CAS1 domain containing 1 [Culex quinquefasciatus]|eukprot:XP_001845070.1 CAS1 domain containing 1 [Culex quinquefasciatus]